MDNSSHIKKTEITLTLPNSVDGLFLTKELLKSKTKALLLFVMGIFKTRNNATSVENSSFKSAPTPRRRLSNPFNFPPFNKKTILRAVVPVLIVVFLLGAVLVATRQDSNRVAGVNAGVDMTPLKTMIINREFKFPLKDESGKDAGEFSYTVESAELRKQIIVKGQSATTVEGRVFLIINLKIVNSLDQGLTINSRDYLRISVNGNDKEWFAPDIHSDPVEAQAISTKNARVGLAINESDKNIRLQVGEIDGEKTVIPLSFK